MTPTKPTIAELLDAYAIAYMDEHNECRYGTPASTRKAQDVLREKEGAVLAHVAGLERDAERYRLLRTKVGFDARYGSAFLACGLGKIDPEETDRAIDAAIAQRGVKS